MFQLQGLNSSVLYEVSHDNWNLEFKDGLTYNDSFKEIVYLMTLEFAFDLQEIEHGIETMLKKDHNAIHFGAARKFLYSFNKNTLMDKVG